MDSLCLVRPLASAIYGRVLLVRHRSSGRHYALKVMSLPHMHARRAVTGPYVQEDGDMELQILRKLGRNLVYSSGSRDNLSNSWSVSPVWSNGVGDDTRAATGGQLGDQHLLTLHQDFVDWTTKTRCLLFDYCPYGDLFSQVSETRGGLPLETARTCFQQISSAVLFLHGRNVAHRDLSLENVLLDSFRRCRLADFGLASAAGSHCSGPRVGKILYMAPEVFTRPLYRPEGDVNAETSTEACYNGLQADIWSLGVVLFILVTGIPPFEKANEVDARFRLVSKPGGSVRALLHAWGQEDRLPRELQDLLDWMLRVDPRQRPTAEQICQHQWLQPASGKRKSVKESGQREKRPSVDEPEAEEDGENLEPQKMASRSDKSWSWSTLRSNKRVKRTG
ncbi:Serine/threonine protein kinase OSK4 [Phytophthora citrophthora]|uniref:Serine/threonine protein kinase OSK4 n=1 Tax=Phytophthora citrophthora TaxID=4793 RepID=A0AAD9LEP7_9STRA|nr:Serine/threonine protein kinase OSK4 [Phytophthora citrophthora]